MNKKDSFVTLNQSTNHLRLSTVPKFFATTVYMTDEDQPPKGCRRLLDEAEDCPG